VDKDDRQLCARELDQLDLFDADARQAMTRTNALSLFPRFQLPRRCS
jgi:hypothetical protein